MSPRTHHRRPPIRERIAAGEGAEISSQLIDAAERLLETRQVATITTRDIAREAGLSDGVLYNYFESKGDLVVAALLRRYDKEVGAFEAGLPEPGAGTIEESLVRCAEALLGLTTATLPIIVGLLGVPDLMHRFLADIHGDDYLGLRTMGRVGAYLEAEQKLGRLADFDIEAAVTTLTGSMFALGMGRMVMGHDAEEVPQRLRSIVQTLLEGLAG